MDPRFSTRQAIHSLHSLSRLPGNVNQLEHLELGLLDVQVFIEAAALAPLGHNCQVVLRHVPHEEQDVHVPGFAGEGRREEKALHLPLLQNREISSAFPRSPTRPCVLLTPPMLTVQALAKPAQRTADDPAGAVS